jgi:hypothetical protein
MVVLEIALLPWLQDRNASHHAMLDTLFLDQRHVPQELSQKQQHVSQISAKAQAIWIYVRCTVQHIHAETAILI